LHILQSQSKAGNARKTLWSGATWYEK